MNSIATNLIPIVSSVPFLIGLMLTTIMALFYFWLRADSFRFTSFAFKRPWVFGSDHRGQFQKLAKESTDSDIGADGMVNSERTLSGIFKHAMTGSDGAEVSEAQFNNAKEYLNVTGQNEVKPAHPIFKVFLFVLILAESVGTGFVLAPFMAKEITPSQANFAAGVIALSVAIILAMLTHVTGEEFAKILRYSKNSGTEGKHQHIKLGSNQQVDAFYIDYNSNTVRDNPPPRRFSNRVTDPGKIGYLWLTISTVFVIALMVGLFELRIGDVNIDATRQAAELVQKNQAGANAGDPFAIQSPQVPPAAQAASDQYVQKTAEEVKQDAKTSGIAAAFILALIYLVTQFTAFIIAFRTTFSGEGKAAYLFTRDMQSFDTFKAKFLAPKIERAESLLAQLRTVRQKSNHRIGKTSFKEFLAQGVEKEKQDKADVIGHAATSIANAPNDAERNLRWELELRNHNFNDQEQAVLVEKVRNQIQRRGQISSPVQLSPVASDFALTSPAALSQVDAEQIDSNEPVHLETLAKSFMDLPNNEQKTAFLKTQKQVMSAKTFDALKAEISRLKQAREAEDEFSDLLD